MKTKSGILFQRPERPTPGKENKLLPDERGYFGDYGGRFVPETLMPALEELKLAYDGLKDDAGLLAGVRAVMPRFFGTPHAAFTWPRT
jgi:tryptophan synthase beta subunit